MTSLLMRARHRKRTFSLPLLALVLLGVSGVGISLTGAVAVMQSAAQSTRTVGAGDVMLGWDASGNSQVAVNVAALTPGSSTQQVADLRNTGSVSLGALQLSLAGTSTGTMSDGVTVAIDRCSVPWALADGRYTCASTITSLSVDRPLPGLVTVTGSPAATPGFVDHLRLTIGLAESSPADAQGQRATLTLIATGVQRKAMQR